MHRKINSMTLAAIFAGIYLIMSALSLALPFLDGIILVIMPIFATYYAAKYHLKEIILFNVATLILCFLVTYADPFFSVLYIFPTLLVGDIFGFLYQKKVPYITTYFILSITFLLTNLFSFYLTNVIYNIDLMKEIFNHPGFIADFSLSFFLIFSMLEAFCCQKIVCNELKKFHLDCFIETKIPTYLYFFILILSIIDVCFLTININIYLCLFVLTMSLSIFSWRKFYHHLPYKTLLCFIFFSIIICCIIPLIANKQFIYIPLIILTINFILQIVYCCQIMYNKRRITKNK